MLLAYSSSLDCYADTALKRRGGVCVFNLGGEGVRMKAADTELLLIQTQMCVSPQEDEPAS